MVDFAFNTAAQVSNTNFSNETESLNGIQQKGKIDSQEVVANNEVDPSTKDDELMSGFQAEKKAEKEKRKHSKEEKLRTEIASLGKVKKTGEKDQKNRKISRQAEARLKIIEQQKFQDLSRTIQERSQSLFSGSEQKYENFFQKLTELSQGKSLTRENIQSTFQQVGLEDVAEQHNALQIVCDVWNKRSSRLNSFSKERSQANDSDSQNDYNFLNNQQQQLERQVQTLAEFQTQLMQNNGARIEDSYKLAPLLRETTAKLNSEITLPPKSFNALILDKILPSRGDPEKTFDLLIGNLVDNFSSREAAFSLFEKNIEIISTCLTQELKSCPDVEISGAIANTLRSVQKAGSVYEQNVHLMNMISSTFSNIRS